MRERGPRKINKRRIGRARAGTEVHRSLRTFSPAGCEACETGTKQDECGGLGNRFVRTRGCFGVADHDEQRVKDIKGRAAVSRVRPMIARVVVLIVVVSQHGLGMFGEAVGPRGNQRRPGCRPCCRWEVSV